MKLTIICILLFISSFSFGQEEQEDDAYLFQTYSLFEVALWNELIGALDNYDSIQLTIDNNTFRIDSTVPLLSFSKDYKFHYSKRNQKIKKIKNSIFTAHFTYNSQGKVSSINFNYSRNARFQLYEGTIDHFAFEYENDKLINCRVYSIYGNNQHNNCIIQYYRCHLTHPKSKLF